MGKPIALFHGSWREVLSFGAGIVRGPVRLFFRDNFFGVDSVVTNSAPAFQATAWNGISSLRARDLSVKGTLTGTIARFSSSLGTTSDADGA